MLKFSKTLMVKKMERLKKLGLFTLILLTFSLFSTSTLALTVESEICYSNDYEKFYHINSYPPPVNLDDNFGDQETFWIHPSSSWDIWCQINATLLAEGEWCYVYLDNATIDSWGYAESLTLCAGIRDDFDNFTYPKGIELAGNPSGISGDIDDDPKVTLLLVDDPNLGGYYAWNNDIFIDSHTNWKEMITCFTGNSYEGFFRGYPLQDFYTCIFAHEFNHLIWFNTERSNDMVTITEGYADHAVYYSDYLSYENSFTSENSLNRDFKTDYFSLHPEQPLLYWNSDTLDLNLANYGKASMFILYLAEKYSDELIHDLKQESIDGPIGIETALTNAGYNISFNDLFLNWITACTIDDEDIENGLYGFENTDFTVNATKTIEILPSTVENVNHYLYGFDVKKLINPPNEFALDITNPYPYSIGISAVIFDNNGWNITKVILTEDDKNKNITTFLSGENIEFAYVITSMMRKETPLTSGIDYETTGPSRLLTYYFVEGHKEPDVDENYSTIITSILGIMLLSNLMLIRRRRKQT
jgi:hypothetical protein